MDSETRVRIGDAVALNGLRRPPRQYTNGVGSGGRPNGRPARIVR
jgi:hypothetical protein